MSLDAQNIAQMARDLQQPQQNENGDSNTNGVKRKAEDQGNQGQQRARRNRYVSIAW